MTDNTPQPAAPALDPVRQKSMDSAFWNGTVWAVMNGFGNPYVAVFAVFLGASAAEVGFVTAIPAGVAAVTCLAGGMLVEKLGRRKPLVFWSMIAQAITWILLALIPFVLAPALWVPAVLVVWGISAIFVNLPSTAWDSMLGDVVPTELRSKYFAKRSRSISAVSLLSTLGAGFLLGWFATGTLWGGAFAGFALCFAVAAIGRIASALLMRGVEEYPYKSEDIIISPRKILEGIGKNEFVNIVFFIALASFAGAIGSTLFAAYALTDLHVSTVVYGVLAVAPMLATVALLPYWGVISDRFGRKKMLFVTTALLPLVPIAWIVFRDPWQLVLVQFFWGFLQAGFSLNALNFVLDASPSSGRATYLGFYNLLCQGGLFIGGLLGGVLVTFAGARFFGLSALETTFLVSAAMGVLPLWWLRNVTRTAYRTEDVYMLWNTGFVLPSLSLLQEIRDTPRYLDRWAVLSLSRLARVPIEGIELSQKTVQLVQKTENALQKDAVGVSDFTLSGLRSLLVQGVDMSEKTFRLVQKTVTALEREFGQKEQLLNQKNTTNSQAASDAALPKKD
jgi:MFS family permease